jgi:hypothetical protein
MKGGSTVTEQERLALGARLVVGDCLRLGGEDSTAALEAATIILSIESDDWIQARAVEHEGMCATLATLDAALEKRRGVRLSIEEKLKKQNPLYGIGQIGPLLPAVTEVGRLANIIEQTEELFGQPEVGSPGSGALDTAKERPAGKGKQRAKGKIKAGRKRRALPRSLRVPKRWVPINYGSERRQP